MELFCVGVLPMHSGSDVMYLSPLSVSVTAKKCDCNFFSKRGSTEL